MREDRLAQIIGNVLGAAEMLNGPTSDAIRVIEKVLHVPELYAEFVQSVNSGTCMCTCLHTVHPVENHAIGCPLQVVTHRPNGV